MNEPVERHAVIYVDVDDTLVRHGSSAPTPIARVIDQVKRLHARGFSLYLWSTGGAEYAQRIATELGVDGCFAGFLPKPTVLIDDQEISTWLLKSFHPREVDDASIDAVLP
jgi:predicted HAD superfamily phosphohydrolase YqeG